MTGSNVPQQLHASEVTYGQTDAAFRIKVIFNDI